MQQRENLREIKEKFQWNLLAYNAMSRGRTQCFFLFIITRLKAQNGRYSINSSSNPLKYQ